MSVFVCMRLSLCLSACAFVFVSLLGTMRPVFAKVFVHVTCGRGSVLLWRHCDTLCTSGFMDDVIFSLFSSGCLMAL